MKTPTLVVFMTFMTLLSATPSVAADPPGNAARGKDLFTRSCTSCHAATNAGKAGDAAPPLSFITRDNKVRPAFIRGWLMDPHPPMPGIALSRQQIADIIAYLESLPER